MSGGTGSNTGPTRHALFLPPFGELSDPNLLAVLAAEAEGAGWDGLFLWDHILRPPSEPPLIADVWITLAAIAASTRRLRIGPMVTPLVRRRPQKLARETVTLDHLSHGRLVLGVGLGVDSAGELSKFGETVDAAARGDQLDEALDVITALWSGDTVHHEGEHYRAEDVRFLPRPAQQPRIPVWVAARAGAARPVRRAARFDGMFPIDVDLAGLAAMIDGVRSARGHLNGFDIAVLAGTGRDLQAAADLGATWAMWDLGPGATATDVRRLIDQSARDRA